LGIDVIEYQKTVISLSVIAVPTGIWCICQARSFFAKAKRIKNKPTSKIGELTEGTREINGRITRGDEKLQSPMAGKPCVYYSFTVSQDKGEAGWELIICEKKSTRFYLEDGTGTAAIEIDGAELVLDTDRHESSGSFNSASPRLEAILARYKKSSKGWVFNKTLHYDETILEVGDELYILGQAKVVKGNVWFKASSGQPLMVSETSGWVLRKRWIDTAVRYTCGGFASFALFLLGAVFWVLNPMDDSRPETSVETKLEESRRASKKLRDDLDLLIKEHEERRRPVKSTPNDFHLLKH
jgi:hypothetical protein